MSIWNKWAKTKVIAPHNTTVTKPFIKTKTKLSVLERLKKSKRNIKDQQNEHNNRKRITLDTLTQKPKTKQVRILQKPDFEKILEGLQNKEEKIFKSKWGAKNGKNTRIKKLIPKVELKKFMRANIPQELLADDTKSVSEFREICRKKFNSDNKWTESYFNSVYYDNLFYLKKEFKNDLKSK